MKCEALVMETLHLVITFQNSNNYFRLLSNSPYRPLATVVSYACNTRA
jgi:hypothetical protein